MERLIDMETNNSKRYRNAPMPHMHSYRSYCKKFSLSKQQALYNLERSQDEMKAWMFKCGIWYFKDYVIIEE